MDDWIVGSEPSERFPLWTRANVGEVFPDPVAPLTFSLMIRQEVEYGWRDALAKTGAFTLDEFAPRHGDRRRVRRLRLPQRLYLPHLR